MNFIETRGNDGSNLAYVSFEEAILSPIASYGGLYVPEYLPELGEQFLLKHIDSSYKQMALDMLSHFDVGIDQDVLEEALDKYDNFDDHQNPVPVVKLDEKLYVSELYRGPTRAFKDMALQPFGVILSSVAQKRSQEYLILAATSGDTGPAALDAFKNRANVKVVCLYPDGGTSDVQRLQMVCEDAPNLKVIGIDGSFDDAQNALKRLLGSQSFEAKLQKHNISVSAANSVNFGRIIFQIIYHIHSYLELVRSGAIGMGEKINLVVPSGNFGNALGAYYASKMCLAVESIIIASNENCVLTELIRTGKYDIRDREVVQTTSPAMDILKSSNIERVLYDMFGVERTKELMFLLDSRGYYELRDSELKQLRSIFSAEFATSKEVKKIISRVFDSGYILEPHTATCIKAYESCADKDIVSVLYSTAEWTKFSPEVAAALGSSENLHDIVALTAVSDRASMPIPAMIKTLFEREIIHKRVVKIEDIEDEILAFL